MPGPGCGAYGNLNNVHDTATLVAGLTRMRSVSPSYTVLSTS